MGFARSKVRSKSPDFQRLRSKSGPVAVTCNIGQVEKKIYMGAAPKQHAHTWTPSELQALFAGFSLLKNFPEKFITLLVQASELLHIAPNTQILRQGQPNEHLYFLISGNVGVYVDGGRV